MTSPVKRSDCRRRVCALTGAHGYLGSRIRQHLEAEGWEVVVLTRRGTPQADAIRWEMGSGSSIQGELLSRSVEALIHAAWDFSQVNRKDMERVNVEGSLRLLADAVGAGVQRLIFISTISAFSGAHSHYGQTKLRVEQAFQQAGGIVLRPGLVYGDTPGGMFGSLRQQIAKSSVIPMIGNGNYRQYLVHEDDLSSVVLAASNASSALAKPITVAHPQGYTFRELLESLARAQNKSIRLVPVPATLLYFGLRTAEMVGMRIAFRSDSVTSLVHQNPAPGFDGDEPLGVKLRQFHA